MRPERLHLHGFGAFRQRTEIDFSGVELFALTGPLGAGKTTVLDGICFALYGSVPRHGKGAVAPVITQGQMEATVGLTFSIGERSYQVARRVRKDAKGKGARVIEASLDGLAADGSVQSLAVGGEVTDRVTTLLGLDFEQFTTCVLLPQGEFARFLHDKPAERQDLLTALLDLGVYDRVGQLATSRQKAAESHLALLDRRLTDLGGVGVEDVDQARNRVLILEQLLAWIEQKLPELESLRRDAAEAATAVTRREAMLEALKVIALPAGIDDLSVRVAVLEQELQATEEQLKVARAQRSDLDRRRQDLPQSSQLRRWLEDHEALTQEKMSRDASVALASGADDSWNTAAEVVMAARTALETAIDADRAAHLRRDLKKGDPCPVCGQPVTTVPRKAAGASIEKAKQVLARAEKDEERRRADRLEAQAALRRHEDRISDLDERLAGVSGPASLQVNLDEVVALEAQVEALMTSMEADEERLTRSRAQREQLTSREAEVRSGARQAWARAVQAGLDPPPIESEDAFEAWRALISWKEEAEPSVLADRDKARAVGDEVEQSRQSIAREIDQRLEQAGVSRGESSPRDTVVDSLSQARRRHDQLREQVEESRQLLAEREVKTREQRLARQLTLELRADRFKKWLFDEVFSALVAGANQRLAELTRGQYELTMEGRDFEVIDNFAAGHRRSVKTLSGGETFLLSLALALSLAEQVASTAIGGSRLDSFFLDEGFGSLDSESLEVVTGVIGELGASGKTVGIVTHVAELAEQMPVRYSVRRGVDGAVIEVQGEAV
jgi:exonuclease SbcC